MRVVEVFDSLQGEGPLAGHPAKFIRLAGCNLRCEWCDTAYAQDSREDETFVSDEALSLLIQAHNPATPLIFTGGEPLLQQHNLPRLFSYFHENQNVWFETNGTIAPLPVLWQRNFTSFTQFVVSPKPDHVYKDVLEFYASHGGHFKFVLGRRAWTPLALMTLVEGMELERDSVWVMPEGATRAEQLENMPWVWDFCVKNNFNFSARLHTLTFDKRRGV